MMGVIFSKTDPEIRIKKHPSPDVRVYKNTPYLDRQGVLLCAYLIKGYIRGLYTFGGKLSISDI